MTQTYSIEQHAKIVKKWIPRTTVPDARNFKGEGILSGVIREKGQPISGMIVQLFHNPSNYFIAHTLTRADGSYSFENIDEEQLYDVIAFDPEGYWEKQVSSRRKPIAHKTFSFRSRTGEAYEIFSGHEARFWRLWFTSHNGGGWYSTCELEFRYGASNRVGGGVPIASSEYPGYEARYAFDKIKNQDYYWCTLEENPTIAWLGYDFGRATRIDAISLTARGGGAPQTPRDFIVQRSDDGAIWSDVTTVSNQTLWSSYEERVFRFPS